MRLAGRDSVGQVSTLDTTQVDAGPFAPVYRLATIGMVGLVTLIAFEAMAVSTAMPTVAGDLDGLSLYGWAFTGFLLANILGLVFAGLWCDRYGPRRSIMVGLVLFAAGLVVSGTASDMYVFIAGRFLQGFGGGQMSVPIYVIIGLVYPDRSRPRIFALISAAWVVPSLVGPLVAGALAGNGLWRAVFLGLLPLLLLAIASLLPTLRRVRAPADPVPVRYSRLLYAGATGAGIALFQLSTQRLAGSGFDWLVGVLAVAGLGLTVVGLRVLWPRGTVTLRRGIPAVVMYRGLLAGAFFGLESLLPLTLTTLHGYSPTAAGIPLTIGAIGWTIGSAIQGRSKAPRYRLVQIGAACVTICALALLLLVLVDGAGWISYPTWIIGGLGMGLGMSTVSVLILDFSPPEDRGANSAALQLSDVSVAAITVGIGGSLVAASALGTFSFTTAIATHDILLAALIGVGVLAAGRLRRPVAS